MQELDQDFKRLEGIIIKLIDQQKLVQMEQKKLNGVFKAQVERYEGVEIKDKKGNMFTPISNDMDAIHLHTASRFADFAGRIVFNDEGQECINFGKHKGKPITQVLMEEPGYYDWMMRGDFPLYTKKVLTAVKLKSSKLMR